MGYEHAPGSKKRLVGLSAALLSHALLIYGFTSGLASELAHGVKRKVEVAIIAENKPPPPPLPEETETEDPQPKPRRRPPKAWQPKPEVMTSSTRSGNAITQTTEDVEQAIQAIDRPEPPPKKEKKKKMKKKRVKISPRLLRGCRLPRYPSRSEEKGEEGTVVLRFLVGADGGVKRSQLVRSSGFERLDNAAKKAFARCKFRPGTVDGVAVSSWVRQPFTWRLQ